MLVKFPNGDLDFVSQCFMSGNVLLLPSVIEIDLQTSLFFTLLFFQKRLFEMNLGGQNGSCRTGLITLRKLKLVILKRLWDHSYITEALIGGSGGWGVRK